MQTLLQTIFGLAGLAFLSYGADFLVKGGVFIAAALKIRPVVIGLTLVAFATSAPELVVSIDAALKGVGDVSAGNVIGSNICNIALILGVAAAISPMAVRPSLLRFDVPVMLLSTFALAACILLRGGVGRLPAGVFLACLVIYLWWTVRNSGNAQPDEEALPDRRLSMAKAVLLVILGLAGLVGGAKLFVNAAIYVARLCHISEAVIGLTVVALGTSLPELATSAVASIRHQNDIAIGNVVGSNIFNVLAILGIAPLIAPIRAPGIGLVDMMAVCAVSVELLALMCLPKRRLGRAAGLLLLAEYVAYVAWLAHGL